MRILLEGDNDEPQDNRFIGLFTISGADFDDGVVPAGGELQCEFVMNDSGNIKLEVAVPSIGGVFLTDRNYYSRQEGQLDFSTEAARVKEEGERTLQRLDEISAIVDDAMTERARNKLAKAWELDPDEPDVERVQETMEAVQDARRMIAQVRKANLKAIWELELKRTTGLFNDHLRELARPIEETAFDNQARTARRAIERNDREFENHNKELRGKNFEILWRQDWFVIDRFNSMSSSPHHFADRARFTELVAAGRSFLESDNIDALRQVVGHLYQIQIDAGSETDLHEIANVIRG